MRVTHDDGVSRVSADINGREVWFQSREVTLQADATAFVMAYLAAAQTSGRDIETKQEVSARLLEQLPMISGMFNQWWQLGPSPDVRCIARAETKASRNERTGLFFSCGMDSMDALIRRHEDVDDLVLVHGFDVALDDSERFQALRKQAEAVAEMAGKDLIVIETNLRSERLFRKGGWVRSHGAAMAAIGQLLGGRMGRMLIASSLSGYDLSPWGSHPMLDHFWSTNQVKFEHFGEDMWRLDKLGMHGSHPMVQKHLCVCWEGRGVPVNCGCCEKCVRNQLGLRIQSHPTPACFPQGVNLEQAIKSLPTIQTISNIYEAALKCEHLDDGIKAAVKAHFERMNDSVGDETHGGAWDAGSLDARVANPRTRKRHEAGSPNGAEVKSYASFLPASRICAESTALMLGMTPEVRTMLAGHFKQLVSVDHNVLSIRKYREWIPQELRHKEKIFHADWMHLDRIDWSVLPPVRAVLGDGIFGNITSMEAHVNFLKLLRDCFPYARLIFRKALCVPIPSVSNDEEARTMLRDAYRAGEISEDDFGLGIRIRGFLQECRDMETARLDNVTLFAECERLERRGFFDKKELELIERFRFNGDYILPTRQQWEGLLEQVGAAYEVRELEGHQWYEYYPIYGIERAQEPSKPSTVVDGQDAQSRQN